MMAPIVFATVPVTCQKRVLTGFMEIFYLFTMTCKNCTPI